jgi:TonB family protein
MTSTRLFRIHPIMRIPMTPISIPRLTVFLAAALLLAQPAGAQQEQRVGAFLVTRETDTVTGRDRSSALVYPRDVERGGYGYILWECSGRTGELTVNVRLGSPPSEEQRRRVFWRFTPGAMDSSWVEPVPGEAGWFIRQADVARFTAQATTATRLMLRTPGDASTEGMEDFFTYDLPGADLALGRLPCARTSPDTVADAVPGEATYELSAVEELPRPTNLREFSAALNENYPPLLRDAGVTGTVQVRLRVLPDGRVDPKSIQVTSSSHDQFNEPTIRAVRVLRFRPARVNGESVPVWIDLPIQWIPS